MGGTEAENRGGSEISNAFSGIITSVEQMRDPLNARALVEIRGRALRQAVDILRMASEMGLPQVGQLGMGEIGRVQAVFAQTWDRDRELASSVFDIFIDIPHLAFARRQRRDHFAQRLFGVVIKKGEITPLTRRSVGIPLGSIGRTVVDTSQQELA